LGIVSLITVIGRLVSTEEGLVVTLDMPADKSWVDAVQKLAMEYADFQFASAHLGRLAPVGAWESLPKAPPVWQPNPLAQPSIYTVFGIDRGAERDHQDYLSAPDWVSAAHYVMRSRGSSYDFICAMAGQVESPALGNWRVLKAALEDEPLVRHSSKRRSRP
jgi:hypothetical protein